METSNSLTCYNITDQFSISNNEAKLKYPVALITDSEINGTRNIFSLYGYTDHWGMSPKIFTTNSSVNYYTIGHYSLTSTDSQKNIRPVISLNNKSIIMEGTGLETNPWIVK